MVHASSLGPARRVRVLHSLAPPDGKTRYVDQMTVGAPDDVSVGYFSWKAALRGRYDVLHIHWPELLIRGKTRRIRFAKRQAMRATLALARVRRIPVIRTVHNVTPHEAGSAAERRVLARVDRATAVSILLNPTTQVASPTETVTILHGHYRDRFAAHPRTAREPGLVLYFGIIRPYKNVDALIDVYASRPRPGSRLRIVGSPSPELRDSIQRRADAAPDVSATLAFVDDAELVREVSAASLVVLPYAEMHNSGAALVALSLDRPILVPRSPSNSALAAEVGPGWVIEYDGPLTDEVLSAAVDVSANLASGERPRLEGRDWDEVGRRHRDVYIAAIAAAGGRAHR